MSAVSIQPTFAFDSSLSLSEIGVLQFCQSISAEVWSGYVDGKLICCWGLIPPTLLSNQAYLWMHSTPAVRDHSFILVRHSQRIIEQVLNRYEKIIGDCRVEADDSIRWLKWLGAEFADSDGPYLSFVIRRK